MTRETGVLAEKVSIWTGSALIVGYARAELTGVVAADAGGLVEEGLLGTGETVAVQGA